MLLKYMNMKKNLLTLFACLVAIVAKGQNLDTIPYFDIEELRTLASTCPLRRTPTASCSLTTSSSGSGVNPCVTPLVGSKPAENPCIV